MKRDISPQTLDLFLGQAKEQLLAIRRDWQVYASQPTDRSPLEAARRGTHQIKGEASMIGLSDFSHIAAFQEELIDELIDGEDNDRLADVIGNTLRALELFTDRLQTPEDERAPLADALVAYRRYRQHPEASDQEQLHQLIYSSETPTSVSPSPSGVDGAMMSAYRVDATDHLQVILDALNRTDDPDEEELLQIRRSIHSIKGGAGTIGFQIAAELAHQIEELLDHISADDIRRLREMEPILIEAVDALGELIETGTAPARLDELTSRLHQAAAQLASQATESSGITGQEDSATQAEERPPSSSQDAAAAIAAIQAELESPVSPELLEVYVEEAEDHIKLIYNGLNALQTAPDDREQLQSVRRSAHTLKGAAGAVGLRVVTQLSHRMEDLLDDLYEHQKSPTKDNLELLLTTTDYLNDLSFGDFDQTSIAEGIVRTYDRYRQLLDGASSSSAGNTVEINYQSPTAAVPTNDAATDSTTPANSTERTSTERTSTERTSTERTSTEPRQMLRVPLDRIDDLVRTVSELIINRTTFEQRMSDFVHGVDELGAILDRLRSVSYEMETKYSIDALASSSIFAGSTPLPGVTVPNILPHTPAQHEFDTLEFDRYNDFHILSRSIGEVATDVNTVTNELRTLIGDFDQLLARQDRLSRDTQDRLMKVRMVPMAVLATRLHRAVRVVASSQEKEVELSIEGEQTELDKTVLEEIADPLLHLLRNAVDHGVEPSDLRVVKGKPSQATIRIRAFYQGTQAVIRISDDGAGLDPVRIGATAVQKGLLSQSELDTMTPQEIFPYIFVPGLTTAREVSEVSGRGVGMDIVRDKVTKLKGTISVDSEPDQGTTFTIRLPLTLAVTRALMVVAGNELFAVPMQSVDQIARLPRETIEQLGDEPVIRLNGTACPLIRLSHQLGLREADGEAPTIPVLIVAAGDTKVAVRVERIIAGRDIVVKTLGTHLRKVPGLIGSTLLGDGTVVPILDPNSLAGNEKDLAVAAPTTRAAAFRGAATTVMIVDDSVSVRRVMENLAKSQGWTPIVAKDGVDAIETLQSLDVVPDIFLLDVEMPRMDGYELLATLRGLETTRERPIVMVTSRSGEKHRSKAFSLGATDYLVKPYQDEQLIGLINRLTLPTETNVG